MKCRHCQSELTLCLCDLGSAPPSNAYLNEETVRSPEKWVPLRVMVCRDCRLVQTEDSLRSEELFSPDYAYFSSASSTWLSHAKDYVELMIRRFSLSSVNRVVEIAANDGYLLQYVRARGIPCLGIEPTAGPAAAAKAKGIEIVESFFGLRCADELLARGVSADLMVANNVLAHVPDINDFLAGFTRLLKPAGVATFEFPHLLNIISSCQFDTLYHEHYSYLSLTALHRIFAANGLRLFDAENLPTHGGSLRVFAARADGSELLGDEESTARVRRLLEKENAAGITTDAFYRGFQSRAESIKNEFLSFLLQARAQGLAVAAYGAAAKGNTLLNFAGVRRDLVPYVVDRSASKQGKFLPGSRIPVVDESRLRETKPAYVVILPWNIQDEIMGQLSYIRSWSGKFVTAVPHLEIQ